MTIVRDLTLTPGERIQRRVSNLEQGHIASQQSGAWIRNVGVTAETQNFTETGAIVNGLSYTIPAYGQYELTMMVDGATAGSGYAQGYILISGVGNTFATYISPQAVRGTMVSQYGGFLEPGTVITGRLARIGGTSFVAAYGGSIVVRKIA